jgi:hypothetical protein
LDGARHPQQHGGGEAISGIPVPVYILEGDFTNDGKPYRAGTTLHIKTGNVHGPHTTENGCRVLVLWPERTSNETADLSDFIVVTT